VFTKKTIRDIDLASKTILLRADYNVPLDGDKITDDYRIKQSLPTLQFLLDKEVKLVICSHLGRPDGRPDPKLSLRPVSKRLEELLDRKVLFAPDCVGEEVEEQVAGLSPGQIILLENVRFHPEEEADDPEFAKQLAKLADVFVQDAFGVVHHPAVSVSEMPKYLPGVAGFLLEKEVDTITNVMNNPVRPLMSVIGGAKIADKLDILHKFIEIADFVAIGGAMANTFLLAEGIKIGKSLADKDEVSVARDILNKAKQKAKDNDFVFYLPQDGVVASKIDKTASTRIVDWDAHVVAEIENYPKLPPKSASFVGNDEIILDIGPFSASFIAGLMQSANTVVWNGALGVTEVPSLLGHIGPFSHGTDIIMEAMLGQFGHRPFSLVGGGDTVGYIENRHMVEYFDHVSTGGGASLELMAGRTLPGVEALENK